MLAITMAMLLQAARPVDPGSPTGFRPSVITMPDWLQRPTGEDMARYYPLRAMREEVEGRATLACTVSAYGTLEGCAVVEESPAAYGFGDAVLSLAPLFKMRPMTKDGSPVSGGMVRIPIRFMLPKPDPEPLEAASLKWESLPIGRDFAAAFPERALRREVEGSSTVICVVQAERGVGDCVVEAERPEGLKFGEAGLRIATKFRLAPGAAPVGARVRIKLRFNLPKG